MPDEMKKGSFSPRLIVCLSRTTEDFIPRGMLPDGIISDIGIDVEEALRFFVDRVQELEGVIQRQAVDLSSLRMQKSILESNLAKQEQELITLKSINRMPTCDAVCRPIHPFQSNRSYTKFEEKN